jgi:hypothetical protein
MGGIHPMKGVIHPQLRQGSPGNSGDPNVRVPVALENKDGIDGHRHGTLLQADISDPLRSLTRRRCGRSRR